MIQVREEQDTLVMAMGMGELEIMVFMEAMEEEVEILDIVMEQIKDSVMVMEHQVVEQHLPVIILQPVSAMIMEHLQPQVVELYPPPTILPHQVCTHLTTHHQEEDLIVIILHSLVVES